jgi:hypothetical protein
VTVERIVEPTRARSMPRRTALWLFAAGLAVVSLSGCGAAEEAESSGVGAVVPPPTASPQPSTTASTIALDSSAVCAELQKVQALNNEMNLIVSQAMEGLGTPGQLDEAAILAGFRDAAVLMEQSLPSLLNAYEAAAVVATPEVAADLRTVGNASALMMPPMIQVLRDATALADLQRIEQAITATPELQQAAVDGGTASLRVDQFTIPTCGFKFSA